MRVLRGGLVLLIGLMLIDGHAQVGHQLRAVSFAFLPDTVIMTAGDTVLFRPLGGHDMTQVDSAVWAEGLAEWNGGFATTNGMDTDLVFTVAGTYYFVCSPHSAVMRGVLIVSDASVSVPVPQSAPAASLMFDVSRRELWLHGFPPGGIVQLIVWDSSGRPIHAGAGVGGSRWPFPENMPASGHYMVTAYGSGMRATTSLVLGN